MLLLMRNWPYITNKSTITLNYNYMKVSNNIEGLSHNLVSNILLPKNTKIVLLDHITEKVYEYQILTDEDIYNYDNSCDELGFRLYEGCNLSIHFI